MKKILFLSFLAMIAIAKTTAQEIKWMDITEAEKGARRIRNKYSSTSIPTGAGGANAWTARRLPSLKWQNI